MLIRRALILATMVVLLTAGPATAQAVNPCNPATTDYNGVCPSTTLTPSTTEAEETKGEVRVASAGEAAEAGGNFARTGTNNVVPLVQAAIVLLGGGTLLVLVARRRRSVRRAAA